MSLFFKIEITGFVVVEIIALIFIPSMRNCLLGLNVK